MTDGVDLPTSRDFEDLTRLSKAHRAHSLCLPFVWIALYGMFAVWNWWPIAVACLVCLSFVTYGSISHDLVHGNLGLSKRTNSFMLSVIELLALRSGHAYQAAHLHHHTRYPREDDIEGAAARMSFGRTILEGVIFQPRIWWWAAHHARRGRKLILAEGIGCVVLLLASVLLAKWTPVFLVYCVLMILGSWIIPLVTSYVPHAPDENGELRQTRLFRGKIASLVAVNTCTTWSIIFIHRFPIIIGLGWQNG
ncbi:MAG TPA: fatty acid desaturase [Lacipirellulaceae bacterium]|jgi:beta-carotene hydroxylase|nr:fatty acid desaturase [Lacipirellulaceae bacterium]